MRTCAHIDIRAPRSERVNQVVFRDAVTLVSTSDDRTVHCWDVGTGAGEEQMAGDGLTLSQDASDKQTPAIYLVTNKANLLLVHLTDSAGASEHGKAKPNKKSMAFFRTNLHTWVCWRQDCGPLRKWRDAAAAGALFVAIAISPIFDLLFGSMCLVDVFTIFLIHVSSLVFLLLSYVAYICCDVCYIYFEMLMSTQGCCCMLQGAVIMNLALKTAIMILHVQPIPPPVTFSKALFEAQSSGSQVSFH